MFENFKEINGLETAPELAKDVGRWLISEWIRKKRTVNIEDFGDKAFAIDTSVTPIHINVDELLEEVEKLLEEWGGRKLKSDEQYWISGTGHGKSSLEWLWREVNTGKRPTQLGLRRAGDRFCEELGLRAIQRIKKTFFINGNTGGEIG